MSSFLISALAFLAVLTVLVFVHELGHYLVARWCGVRVETFSIGFGREIWGRTDKAGTRWRIAWIPFGGYVKFFGDVNASSAPDGKFLDGLSEAERAVAFHHKSLPRRTAIVAAGPFANFLYAIVVLAVMFMVYGQRVTPPEIGRVLPDSAGAAAGFLPGDIVRTIDGQRIYRFEEVFQFSSMNPERTIQVEIERGGKRIELRATPRLVELDDEAGVMQRIGDLGLMAANQAKVGAIRPDSPAAAAGFRPGDLIVSVDGRPLDSFEDLQDTVGASEGRRLRIGIVRGGQPIVLPVAAQAQVLETRSGEQVTRWLIGIQRAERELVTYGPLAALWEATVTSGNMLVLTAQYVGQMIAGERGTEDLGGPLRIAHVSGQVAQIGIEELIRFTVLLSLNLGFINLLPIPILDGGHLLLYAFEAVRGRPLAERYQEYAFRIGLAMILTLTVFATWNDLVNLRIVAFLTGLFS